MMKPTRHQAREVALQILYRHDIGLQSASAGYTSPSATHANAALAGSETVTTQSASAAALDLIAELNRHFDHFGVPTDLRGFSAELVAGSLREIASLDALLEKHASNWKIGRMGFVDRNLLRMAIYEMSRFPETPTSVVIDEAVELAKQFGTAESPAFINGVLDAVKGSLKTPMPTPAAS